MSERETTDLLDWQCGGCQRWWSREARKCIKCGAARPVVSRAAGGERAGLVERITAYLTGGGLFNPELANHEAVRDLLIACRDALSSAPAPEERHRRFAEAVNRRISYNVDGSSVYVEFRSERDAVLFEEAMRGCDRHPDPDFRPVLASPPSGAGSPVDDSELRATGDGRMRMDAYYYAFDKTGAVEVDRILSAIAHAGKAYHHTDQWLEGGCVAMIQRWANRAADAFRAAPPAAGREPSELLDAARALVERIDLIHANDDYRGVWSLAFAHGHRYAGPTYEAELARLRAALGASAQTNTGEAR